MELFAAGGHLLAPSLPRLVAALLGLMIHGIWMLIWSYLLAAFLLRPRGGAASLAAGILAAIALGASLLLPDVMAGPVSTLTLAESVLVHVVLALSLTIGTRFAPQR
jgi:hypothetical protein